VFNLLFQLLTQVVLGIMLRNILRAELWLTNMETMLEKEVKFIKLQLLVILLVIPLKILQAHLLTFLLSLWLFFPSFLDLNLPKFTLFLDLLMNNLDLFYKILFKLCIIILIYNNIKTSTINKFYLHELTKSIKTNPIRLIILMVIK
jgi:hypothetical protein